MTSPSRDEIIRALIEEVRTQESPGRLAEINKQLSSWYANISEEASGLEIYMPQRWIDLRKDQKTDTATTKALEASEEGVRLSHLKRQLKYIEKVMSSIKSVLRVKEGEAYNAF